MSVEPDPYRILGLNRGASADDVRRAYRRLVKENHPDSAGEGALPRFLAIQAAYEALSGGPTTRRGGGRAGAVRSTQRDPWRADPDRARTTRDSSRRPGRPPSGPEQSAGSGGRRTGSTDTTAAPGGPGPRPRPRPAGAAGPTRADSARTSGGSGRGGRGTADAGESQRTPGERPRRDGRKRAPNKATLGSTSYDAADDEPFEPEWSGGTWYGASSGTYWTINPKEYADPRKHGPEYQRRARRGTAAGGVGGTARGRDAASDADPLETDEPPFSDPTDAEAPSPDDGPATWAAGWPPGSAASSSRWDAAAGPRGDASSDAMDGVDPFAAAAQVAMSLAGTPRGFMARIGLALIGWPAIGLALTTVAGEITGCGRFAASCVDLFGVGTWLGQLLIIVILLALPSVAALSAVGSLVALAASVPTAVILSATGGSHEPAASATILGTVLVLAYAAGVVAAVVRRRRIARLP